MRYSRLLWSHRSPSEPVEILSEHGPDGWETRKIEIFLDDSIAFASAEESAGGARLSEIRCPPDDEVESPDMTVVAMTRDEFEQAWLRVRREAAIHS